MGRPPPAHFSNSFVGAPSRWNLSQESLVGLALWGLLLGFFLAWPLAPAQAVELPVYQFSVHLSTLEHTISGRMRIELPPDDPRAGKALLFHLPPNRFIKKDRRGRRRNLESLHFETNFTGGQRSDPLWPSGFSEGRVVIERITDGAGHDLTFRYEDNPLIQEGFTPSKGLLRVGAGALPVPEQAPGQGSLKTTYAVIIHFTTHLPRRYWDGWSEEGILAELWHPVLANFRNGTWERDPLATRPGRFKANVTVDQKGRLFMGRAWAGDVSPVQAFQMPFVTGMPLRSLALVFVTTPLVLAHHDYDHSIFSFYNKGDGRVGRLTLEIVNDFLTFIRSKYGLPPPDTRIAIIEVDTPPGDIRTVGNIILIPRDFYTNHRVLDRILLVQLARAIAQIWFGEAVWSNRDRQSWLHLGLSGYLAMDYFETLFGADGGVHSILDWLQPKLREHFYELPVRGQIRLGKDAPLLISLSKYHREGVARINAHHKGPLVFRALFYVMGKEAFGRALNALYFKHRFSDVTEATANRVFSEIVGRDLTPFFKAWFQGAPRIDFSVKKASEIKTSTGYRVTVQVERSGTSMLPVEVQVVSDTGEKKSLRWEAGASGATFHFEIKDQMSVVQIDPDEFWLEVDRKNNYSHTLFRVRPIFDWPKQREVLVTLRGAAGNNNVDGNYLGLGARLQLDENNLFELIPIWGQRTGFQNYRITWEHRQFLHPDLNVLLSAGKLGGLRNESLGFRYSIVDNDAYRLRSGISFNNEQVEPLTLVDQGVVISQASGPVNNVEYLIDFDRKPGLFYGGSADLKVTDSHIGYGSDFEFTTFTFEMNHSLYLGESYSVTLGGVRGGSTGNPPIQKRHDLSGPLRGYPRLVELSFEEIYAVHLNLGIVLSKGSYGGVFKLRGVTGFLFGDGGRGWNNGEHSEDRPYRKDVGMGLEFKVSLLKLQQFPLRAEVAYPIGDPDYHSPRLIMFGLFRF